MQVSYTVWGTGNVVASRMRGSCTRRGDSIVKREEIQQVERVFFISRTQFRDFSMTSRNCGVFLI